MITRLTNLIKKIDREARYLNKIAVVSVVTVGNVVTVSGLISAKSVISIIIVRVFAVI